MEDETKKTDEEVDLNIPAKPVPPMPEIPAEDAPAV